MVRRVTADPRADRSERPQGVHDLDSRQTRHPPRSENRFLRNVAPFQPRQRQVYKNCGSRRKSRRCLDHSWRSDSTVEWVGGIQRQGWCAFSGNVAGDHRNPTACWSEFVLWCAAASEVNRADWTSVSHRQDAKTQGCPRFSTVQNLRAGPVAGLPHPRHPKRLPRWGPRASRQNACTWGACAAGGAAPPAPPAHSRFEPFWSEDLNTVN